MGSARLILLCWRSEAHAIPGNVDPAIVTLANFHLILPVDLWNDDHRPGQRVARNDLDFVMGCRNTADSPKSASSSQRPATPARSSTPSRLSGRSLFSEQTFWTMLSTPGTSADYLSERTFPVDASSPATKQEV